MKKLFLTLFIFSSTFALQSQALNRISKLGKNGRVAVVAVDSPSYQSGQRLDVFRGRYQVGIAELIKYSQNNNRQAFIKVITGTIKVGDTLVAQETKEKEEDFFAPQSSQSQFSSNDDDYRSFFIGLFLGYDYELRNEYIGAGFSGGVYSGYKFSSKFSAGLRINYGILPITIPASTTTTGTVTVRKSEAKDNLTTLYMLLRGGYHITPELYVGPTLGMLRSSVQSTSDMSPAFGAEVAYEFPLSEEWSLGANIAYTHATRTGGFGTVNSNICSSLQF